MIKIDQCVSYETSQSPIIADEFSGAIKALILEMQESTRTGWTAVRLLPVVVAVGKLLSLAEKKCGVLISGHEMLS